MNNRTESDRDLVPRPAAGQDSFDAKRTNPAAPTGAGAGPGAGNSSLTHDASVESDPRNEAAVVTTGTAAGEWTEPTPNENAEQASLPAGDKQLNPADRGDKPA
ncbi:hypothetical protein [Chitinasiproducens palmae]|uniref:Uncharacterized protein n=1 Tax=Chitinasiproducens palmae TaxID=1770053 RepID=A0A1H2PQP9_9BURK|nr:hypothetical protein [Chitinasiproducens palmae]SDV49153.1 hypothetical protein SAMN05216551_107110 [Chitinasiproducens palmae]